ncbi:MAG TPA: hypothetical protein VK986_23370 [Tepidisphaeraceae bacterium]|nr:hypothetical protein [Tepidisphaeraceae bacterium]
MGRFRSDRPTDAPARVRTFSGSSGYLIATAIVACALANGCDDKKKQAAQDGAGATPGSPDVVAPQQILRAVSLDASGPILNEASLKIAAARNETASVVLQLSHLPKPKDKSVLTLRIQPLQFQGENAQIGVERMKVYQVVNMPVDANRAGYVRHTGLKGAARSMPRALLPVPLQGDSINVTALRDPAEPLKPASRIGISDEPATLWVDLAIPPTAKPGLYATTVEVLQDGRRLDSAPLTVNVYDFVLPDERHLHMVGRIEWDSLEALYPDVFENVTPGLIDRKGKKYEPAVKLLDRLVAMAQEHRCTAVVPRLQPVAKWPANAPPQVFWGEFDALVGPWMTGEAFADKVPLGYWPLPRVDFLDRFPQPLQIAYWAEATSHFNQNNWADRSWVEVEKESPGRATAAECIKLSAHAAAIMTAHPRTRVTLPLEDAQLQFLNADNPALLNAGATDRLMAAAPGLVYTPTPADKRWPAGAARPQHWLRTDLPGLVPYIGAGGDERDVRLWAWLAFYRQARVIGWDGALPHSKSPTDAADPNELTWFYPGHWFGLDEPVPTIQLKWLRRAQQDFEYLHIARERGQSLNVLVMSPLMIKPVQIPVNAEQDPTLGLWSGTTDPAAWAKALDLLARNILLRPPGQELDPIKEAELNQHTMKWIEPQEKPLLAARQTTWGWAARPGNWVDLHLGLDVYNSSGVVLEGEMGWKDAPRGWEFNPRPVTIGPLEAVKIFHVKRFGMTVAVDLDRITPEARKPVQIQFTDALRKRPLPSYLTVSAPVAASDKREGRLAIDGNLGDWDDAADAIHLGPLVQMLDRPTVQQQQFNVASTHSAVYSNWAAKQFYVAFKVDGVAAAEGRAEGNFVDYQGPLRRAWGEDLCEILIQPIYIDGPGQITHIVVKPRGQLVTSVKASAKDRRLQAGGFKEVLNETRYKAAPVVDGTWRGELAIPWELINDQAHQGTRPTLMRFNFSQYKVATGESSSWAGPVDFGRDDTFTGLLYLRDQKVPGMGDARSPSLNQPVGERLFGR